MSAPITERPYYDVTIWGWYGKDSHTQYVRTVGLYRDEKEKDMAVQEALAWAEDAIKRTPYSKMKVVVLKKVRTEYFVT